MKYRSSFCFLLLIFIPLPGIGQEKYSISELVHGIDSILQAKVSNNEIPGAVIGIKIDGKEVLHAAYGFSERYDFNHVEINPPLKMKTSTLFDIASLTKVVGTTTSIMLLADKGELSVDDHVSKYIKAFGTGDKKDITIRHLITHTAGLYEWYPLYYRVSDKKACFDLIGELPLKYPVGKQRMYSDLGFVLLGEIIELVSGMPLDKFMEKNIFIPLNMGNTMFNPLKKEITGNIAATSHGNPYEKRMVYDSTLGFRVREIDPGQWNGWRQHTLKGEVNDGNAWYANGGISGAAGLFSSVDDLQKIVDMLLNEGKAGSKQFISAKTIKAFLTRDSFGNGLGWMMDPGNSFMKNAPDGTFGHTGFTGTSIVAIPSEKISVILLINRQNTGLLSNGEYYNVSPLRQNVFNIILNYRNKILKD